MKFIDFNKIIYRYIFINYFKNCIIYLLAISCVILLFEYIEIFRRYNLLIEDGNSINPVALLPLINLPSFVYNLTPFVVFFASFTTYYKLNSSNEIWILRAIGLKALSFISPMLFASFIIAMVNFTITTYAIDIGYKIKDDIQGKAKKQKNISMENNIFWILEEYEDNYKVAFATIDKKEKVDKNKDIQLSKVFSLEYSRINKKVINSYSANNGTYNAQSLTLYNAYKNNNNNNKTIANVKINMKQNFNEASLKQRNLNELSPYNILSIIFSSTKHNNKTKIYLKALMFYVANIFFIINLSTTGATLSFGLTRQQNFFVLLGKAILSCFAFYSFYSLSISFGQSGILSMFNSVVIPLIIITLLNLMILFKKENGY